MDLFAAELQRQYGMESCSESPGDWGNSVMAQEEAIASAAINVRKELMQRHEPGNKVKLLISLTSNMSRKMKQGEETKGMLREAGSASVLGSMTEQTLSAMLIVRMNHVCKRADVLGLATVSKRLLGLIFKKRSLGLLPEGLKLLKELVQAHTDYAMPAPNAKLIKRRIHLVLLTMDPDCFAALHAYLPLIGSIIDDPNSKMDVVSVSDMLGARLMYDDPDGDGVSAVEKQGQPLNPHEENEHLARILDFLLKNGLELEEDGDVTGLLLKCLPAPRQISGLKHYGLLF
eukprot:m.44231 g.44231  ORF g.44231 m.44231 type:complete len:288 (-) comp12999_c0_seq2:774-1637(-)